MQKPVFCTFSHFARLQRAFSPWCFVFCLGAPKGAPIPKKNLFLSWRACGAPFSLFPTCFPLGAPAARHFPLFFWGAPAAHNFSLGWLAHIPYICCAQFPPWPACSYTVYLLRAFARICAHLRAFARICAQLRAFARICAKKCKILLPSCIVWCMIHMEGGLS